MIYCATNFLNGEIKDLYRWWTGKNAKDFFSTLKTLYIVALDDEIAGCAMLIIMKDPIFARVWGLVENVYVKSNYRRKGVGQGIMNKVEETARSYSCEFIKLTSRKESGQALYKKLGYDTGMSFYKKLA